MLVTPPPPLFRVASNTRPCSKFGGTTLNGGRREVSILSYRPGTSSDLKQDRLFFRESVSTFLQLVANQLQKYLRHCTVFWLKWPVHDLVLVTAPPPLFKVASNTRPCSKFGGTTLNEGRREVSILSHRPVTSSDLKQDRLFFRESVSTFLQLVV